VAANIDLQWNGMDDLNYLAEKYPKSTLSVGVDLKDSLNITDEQIDALLDVLTSYNRPIFLRLGYGTNDAPDAYVSVWKTFHERIQVKGSQNVALVWESTSCEESSLADWYPGDESVDWVGARYECSDATIQFAREYLKPVMLHASSQGAGEWFAPFFQFVTDNNDVVRAVMYVNTGDSRLSNVDSIKNWKTETKKSFWLRANPGLFDDLGQ
jgi:hypothetical protein